MTVKLRLEYKFKYVLFNAFEPCSKGLREAFEPISVHQFKQRHLSANCYLYTQHMDYKPVQATDLEEVTCL